MQRRKTILNALHKRGIYFALPRPVVFLSLTVDSFSQYRSVACRWLLGQNQRRLLFFAIDYSDNRWHYIAHLLESHTRLLFALHRYWDLECQTVSLSCTDPWPWWVFHTLEAKSAPFYPLPSDLSCDLSRRDRHHRKNSERKKPTPDKWSFKFGSVVSGITSVEFFLPRASLSAVSIHAFTVTFPLLEIILNQ